MIMVYFFPGNSRSFYLQDIALSKQKSREADPEPENYFLRHSAFNCSVKYAEMTGRGSISRVLK
jgi:hypothetical protein